MEESSENQVTVECDGITKVIDCDYRAVQLDQVRSFNVKQRGFGEQKVLPLVPLPKMVTIKRGTEERGFLVDPIFDIRRLSTLNFEREVTIVPDSQSQPTSSASLTLNQLKRTMDRPIPIPPIPLEVISEILSHLGKNDLLQCRLVNQSWNELSLKILRNPKYGHEQKLTKYSIPKFIKLFKERHEKWVLSSFHLHLDFRYDEDEENSLFDSEDEDEENGLSDSKDEENGLFDSEDEAEENGLSDSKDEENGLFDSEDEAEENGLSDSKDEENGLFDSEDEAEENGLSDSKDEENGPSDSKDEENGPSDSKDEENDLSDSKGQENALSDSKGEENGTSDSEGEENALSDSDGEKSVHYISGKSYKFLFFNEIPNYIKQLQTLFGEKCVSSLTLMHDSYNEFTIETYAVEYAKYLISILTLIAPSLTSLDLSEFSLRYEPEHDALTLELMLRKTRLEFPSLSKLMSCPPPIYLDVQWQEQYDDENELHSFLIGKSKNLKELKVKCPSDLLVIEKQIGDLRKLKIVDVLKFENPGTFIFPTLPVLKDLSLTYSTGLLDHVILHEFLSSFSTSLQSLTIEFKEIPSNPFPRLITLRYLQIKVSTPTKTRAHVDPGKLNLNSEAFPVLESVDISTKIYFESADANSGYSEDEWILGTVKSLRITVFNCPAENISKTSAKEKDYVDQLQKLFPNVTSLTLVNRSDGPEAYFNQLLIAFIQSDGAPRIQELKLQNCTENFLGQILNGLDPDCQPRVVIENMRLDEKSLKSIKKIFRGFSGISELSVDTRMEYIDGVESRLITCEAPSPIHLKMTGLEKIIIHTGVSRFPWERVRNQKDLFLMSLPKCLPLLRQIDISQRMLGDDKEFWEQQIIRVQDSFPDLIINITTHN